MYIRSLGAQNLFAQTCFLFGPRQTGKSTLLRELFPKAPYYDLLRASEMRRLSANPEVFGEECRALWHPGQPQSAPIIVDEIQKLPELLDEVHSLISRFGLKFVLTGSSPRKLLRGGGNLLGGRGVRRQLLPLTSHEIPDFSLDRALNHGLLPPHYESSDPGPLLDAYVSNYLGEEIIAEALSRNLPAFQRVLAAAAFSNGQTVNFTSIARDVGVAANTVKGYFEVFTDTLLGSWLPAWRKKSKRRIVESPKFYFFDVGIVNELSRRGRLLPGSVEYGAAFEHLVHMELRALVSYRMPGRELAYWRTSSGFEVDFVLGDGEVAIEVKSTESPTSDHMKGLRAWREENPKSRAILVARSPRARRTDDGIEILPWHSFLKSLWALEI